MSEKPPFLGFLRTTPKDTITIGENGHKKSPSVFKYTWEYGVNPRPIATVSLPFSTKIKNREGFEETVFFPPDAIAREIQEIITHRSNGSVEGFEWKNYKDWRPIDLKSSNHPNLQSVLTEEIDSKWKIFNSPDAISSLSSLELVTFESLGIRLPTKFLFDLIFTCPTSWGQGARVFERGSNSWQMIAPPTYRIEKRHFLMRQRTK